MHIAIAGNIGSGKTTLTTLLSKHYSWEAQYEDVDDNPYLNDFYKDMQRWSFNLQIYFLNSRFAQVQEIHNGDKDVIQDRTMYEDAFIFAPNLHAMGLMSTRDFENYKNLEIVSMEPGFKCISKGFTKKPERLFLKSFLSFLYLCLVALISSPTKVNS